MDYVDQQMDANPIRDFDVPTSPMPKPTSPAQELIRAYVALDAFQQKVVYLAVCELQYTIPSPYIQREVESILTNPNHPLFKH